MPENLIILDRDGVINHDSDSYIKTPDEWLPINGVGPAIARLNQAGYKLGIATNQSGLSRGFFDLETLDKMHVKMADYLANYHGHIDQIVFCPDHPDNPGPNRKPNPGMAKQLLTQFSAIPEQTWFVGDNISDIQCAINSGCRPALVLTGKGKRTIKKSDWNDYNVPVFDDLADFVEQLLN